MADWANGGLATYHENLPRLRRARASYHEAQAREDEHLTGGNPWKRSQCAIRQRLHIGDQSISRGARSSEEG